MPSSALRDRIGGLLMTGFAGTDMAGVPLDLAGQLAGVILFKHNLRSVSQIRELTDGLRERWRAGNAGRSDGPPLIAIDQEGGTVSRLAGIGTTTPSAMALGAARDPGATEQMYRIIGAELAALGVNLNYAPVADVNNNPDNPVIGIRSFGEDPQSVAAHVTAAIAGLHSAGVGATAKHFPGHGDTSVDSHSDLPVIKHDASRLRAFELVPFGAAVAAGVDAIMTAHILFPAFGEESTPATLSHALLTGVLRAELSFDGVICTDCMEMNAIAAHHTPENAAVMAVAAGADLVQFSHSPDKVRAALQGLREALDDGRLAPDQVERSLERVARVRHKRALLDPQSGSLPSDPLHAVGGEQHQQAALDVARRAVTVIRDPHKVLPVRISSGQRVFVVRFSADMHTPVEDKGSLQQTAMGKVFAGQGARVHEQTRTVDPAGHEYKQLLMASGAADFIVALTARAGQHPLQARAVSDLMMLGKRVVAVATREPYDARILPADMTVVAAFGDDPHALQAAAEVICGTSVAVGSSPVTIGPDSQTAAEKSVP